MRDITPDKSNVMRSLKNRNYGVDFYQRDYVWEKDTILTLLNDIFYAFDTSYFEHKDSDIDSKNIDKFNWYYLNVFITNKVDSTIFIVDGQQRLTSLTLIALFLYKKAKLKGFDGLEKTLKECVLDINPDGDKLFNIDHNKRENVMRHLLEGDKFQYKNTTEKNILDRYKDVENFFDKQDMDDKKLKVFCLYFLYRLILVELSIDKQNDVPMIFEAINDRGEKLLSFEILKGKLIGILDKDDIEKYNALWIDALSNVSNKEDIFFIDYIKSQTIFQKNSSIENKINNEYHRYLFENNDIANFFGFQKTNNNKIKNIKNFIEKKLVYYANLYGKITKNEDKYLMYNNTINGLSGVYQNILSACELNDINEDIKITKIAKEYDRLYVILMLNQAYNSNTFQEISYRLNELLKNEEIGRYRNIFNNLILDELGKNTNKDDIKNILGYSVFNSNSYRNLNVKFIRYLFSRIEEYICSELNQSMKNSVQHISTKTGEKTGYHVEHILSYNDDNRQLFDSDDEFDEKRNRLGALLLLNGRSNISSGNETYEDKLKTYIKDLVWGQTLCSDFYHTNPNFKDFNMAFQDKTDLQFKSIDKFDKDAIEYRTRLLYQLVKIVWEID